MLASLTPFLRGDVIMRGREREDSRDPRYRRIEGIVDKSNCPPLGGFAAWVVLT